MNQRPTSTVATEIAPAENQHAQRLDPPAAHVPAPHEIEYEVQHRLQRHPALKFTRLHVHRCEAGICLEGFLESNEFEIDLCDVVREVAGVTSVLNRVVLARPGSLTPKKR
ncbi:MAG: hypothetical protein NTZ32_20935 [Planctomycetales bacterium]|nr:hypothetical protein [Planctomycetales bacterium]